MDHDEFARRAEALRARLYRTAYLYLGSEADALEAVDEGVYQALRALRQLRQPDFFETWLTRIVLNACYRELRRRRRLAGEEALPESAGPDAYDALPLKEAVRRLRGIDCKGRGTSCPDQLAQGLENALAQK